MQHRLADQVRECRGQTQFVEVRDALVVLERVDLEARLVKVQARKRCAGHSPEIQTRDQLGLEQTVRRDRVCRGVARVLGPQSIFNTMKPTTPAAKPTFTVVEPDTAAPLTLTARIELAVISIPTARLPADPHTIQSFH